MLVAAILILGSGGAYWWMFVRTPPISPSGVNTVNDAMIDANVKTNETSGDPESSDEIANTTSSESEALNATDTPPEISTPEDQFNITEPEDTANETSVIETTAGELLWNVETSIRYPPDDEVERAKKWLDNVSNSELIRVTGMLINQEIEEREDFRGNKYWAIYLGDFEETGRITQVKVTIKDAAEVQKFKDLNLNKGDKLQVEGKYGGMTSTGGALLGDCKIIQKIINP